MPKQTILRVIYSLTAKFLFSFICYICNMIEKYIDCRKEPEVDLDLKYLKIIDDLFQDNILTRNDLISNLESFIANFSKEKIKLLWSIYWNEDKIKLFYERHFESECDFVNKIIKYIENNNIQSLILLWDLDQTIISKSANWKNSFSDYVRPSFIFLSKYLKYNIPDIQHWILSSREYSNVYRVKESLNSIISTSPFFTSDLVYSSDKTQSVDFLESSMRDLIPEKLINKSIIEKINKHYIVSSTYPNNKVILIDDTMPLIYENEWKWIVIDPRISFNFPRFWMNLNSLHRNHEIYFISQLVNILND